MAHLLQVPSKSGLKDKSNSLLATKSGVASKSDAKSRSKFSSHSRVHTGSRYGFSDGADEDDWVQAKDPVAPTDQLVLTAAELKEELTRMLRGDNKHAPDNIVRFSMLERAFVQSGTVEQMELHFAMDGNLVHIESEEAKRQLAQGSKLASQQKHASTFTMAGKEDGDLTTATSEVGEDGDVVGEGESQVAPVAGEECAGTNPTGSSATSTDMQDFMADSQSGPLRNQFNFSERASQTLNNTSKNKAVETDPAPRSTFAGSCSQWEIYDAYIKHQGKQEALSKKEPRKKLESSSFAMPKERPTERGPSHKRDTDSVWGSVAMQLDPSVVSVLERMVVLNIVDDISQDYKFWEDPTDATKEKEGSLLPLWKFVFEPARKRHVTALCWNPRYDDLFAAGFGSYDYTKQADGHVCLFSLKNPSFPVRHLPTSSGVMCLDFNREHPHLLAVGLYDGTVAVYNLNVRTTEPFSRSTVKCGKHTDTVWQVRWQPDDLAGFSNFCSISSDGRVTAWTLMRTELQHADVILLRPKEGATAASVFNLSSGSCIAFNPHAVHMFLVGTEEGTLHKCSKAYTSKFLHSYSAHSMTVYAVEWNLFHSRVFATCGADWQLKIWDHTLLAPVFVYDLGNAVGDMAWAPFSSTVFAAVTTDGRVHLFDISVDKYAPLCSQHVARKGKLTHLAFKPNDPVIIVGDDRGNITSFKLSPNLRKVLKVSRVGTGTGERGLKCYLDRRRGGDGGRNVR